MRKWFELCKGQSICGIKMDGRTYFCSGMTVERILDNDVIIRHPYGDLEAVPKSATFYVRETT